MKNKKRWMRENGCRLPRFMKYEKYFVVIVVCTVNKKMNQIVVAFSMTVSLKALISHHHQYSYLISTCITFCMDDK